MTVSRLVFNELCIDLTGRRVTCCQKVIVLSPLEFDLLGYLAWNSGRG